MWRKCAEGLLFYAHAICDEWEKRGYKDTCRDKITDAFSIGVRDGFVQRTSGVLVPEWWGDYRVHASHRSNLLRKNPDHYRQYWAEETDKLDYYWPV